MVLIEYCRLDNTDLFVIVLEAGKSTINRLVLVRKHSSHLKEKISFILQPSMSDNVLGRQV